MSYMSKEEIAVWLKENYENNACQFIVDFTNLFYDIDGSFNEPYFKQAEFMNCLKDVDRVVTVLKARQCKKYNTIISTTSGDYTIQELFKKKFRGKVITLNDSKKFVEDKVINVWHSGIQECYQITLDNGKKLSLTADDFVNTSIGWVKVKNLSTTHYVINSQDIRTSVLESKVVEVIYEGQFDTYDMETMTYESYFANGIMVHNCGISTAIVGYAVHQAYFSKYPEIMVISATKEQALKVLTRIKECFYALPEILQVEFLQNSAQKLKLSNGVTIISLSSNPRSMRGWTGLWLWDEATMLTTREQKEVWEAIYPSITKGGKVIMVSTPFGTEGIFYDFCTKTYAEITGNEEVTTEVRQFKIHWKDVPHIVHAVEKEGLFDALTPETIEQEYELMFKDENIDEQFFTRDFILTFMKESDEIIPLYTSYTSLGIPHTYAKLTELDEELPNDYIITSLEEVYDDITAGWDIASTENDSVLSVVGKLKGSTIKHKIGEFLVNRVAVGYDNIDTQLKYMLRIIKVMCVKRFNMDKTGVGKAVYDNIVNNYKELAVMTYGYDYNTEDKLGDFNDLKNMMIKGNFKRSWKDGKQTSECLKQYTNIRLNAMTQSLKAKGRRKDDIPNADMLATREKARKVKPKVRMI